MAILQYGAPVHVLDSTTPSLLLQFALIFNFSAVAVPARLHGNSEIASRYKTPTALGRAFTLLPLGRIDVYFVVVDVPTLASILTCWVREGVSVAKRIVAVKSASHPCSGGPAQ